MKLVKNWSTHLLFSTLFNFHSIEWNLNKNWGRTMKAQFRVPGPYMRLYASRKPLTDLSLSVLAQFLFKFCLIFVRFLFNFCSISVEIPFNWINIELILNGNWTGSKKADELTHCIINWSSKPTALADIIIAIIVLEEIDVMLCREKWQLHSQMTTSFANVIITVSNLH